MKAGAVSRLGEFGRIAEFFRPLAAECAGAYGLTDDAAVLPARAEMDRVYTTDAMVAGVHFFANDPPADIAAKLLRVNLSDLAAMGAEPEAYLLTLALPKDYGDDWVSAFADGLKQDQAEFGVRLCGGDSVRTEGQAVLSVTAIGQVPKGQAVRRKASRAATHVAVTGTIGDAALGLLVARGELKVSEANAAFLLSRLRRPIPRLSYGPWLRTHAAAALDISDGLVADLGHLCEESKMAAVIAWDSVPLSEAARAVLAQDPALWEVVLTGGDDYELCLFLDDAAAQTLPTKMTIVGRIQPATAPLVQVVDSNGQPVSFACTGWTHF